MQKSVTVMQPQHLIPEKSSMYVCVCYQNTILLLKLNYLGQDANPSSNEARRKDEEGKGKWGGEKIREQEMRSSDCTCMNYKMSDRIHTFNFLFQIFSHSFSHKTRYSPIA